MRRIAAPRTREANSCRAFHWGLSQQCTVVEEQNVSLKLKGSQKDLRKTPDHYCTHRELKEETKSGGGVCGDITATLRAEGHPQIWAPRVKQEETKEEN